MTISEAIDYIEDINSTVSWTKEQETDREFFENVAEWLEELKVLREKAKGDKWYQQGRADAIDEFANMLKAFICDKGMEEDGEQFAIFTKHYIDLFAKGLKENKNE